MLSLNDLAGRVLVSAAVIAVILAVEIELAVAASAAIGDATVTVQNLAESI